MPLPLQRWTAAVPGALTQLKQQECEWQKFPSEVECPCPKKFRVGVYCRFMLECGGRSALARREKSRRVVGAGWDLMSVLDVIVLPTFSEQGQYSCSNGACGIVFRSLKPILCPKLDRNRRQGQPYLSNKKRFSTSGSVSSSEWL